MEGSEQRGEVKASLASTDGFEPAAEALNIGPGQQTKPTFRRVLGGCTSVVGGIGANYSSFWSHQRVEAHVGPAHKQERC